MICGKDLITKFLDETNETRESIEITTAEQDAPEFDRNSQVGRDSIDLRIGSVGYKIKCNYNFINTLDSKIDEYFIDFTLPKEGYIIEPGETIIVSTVERIKLTGNITGELTGRTRFARMGLSVCTATKFQSYSNAVIVLQICNHNKVPLKIFPYQMLAQLVIYQVDGIPNEKRGNYYNESLLKKPIISNNEFVSFDPERKNLVERQKPKEISDLDVNGKSDTKKRIKDNNKFMNAVSKVSSALSAIIGLLIGILCSLSSLNATYISVLAISSTLLTIMSVFFDIAKDNNLID